MNILIFEYITGGGLVGEVLPASLVSEGELMLNAVVNDCAELSNVQVSILRDYRLQDAQIFNNINNAIGKEYIISLDNGYDEVVECLEKKIDALLIIAPEKDGILSSLCETYSNRSFTLMNSSARSIALVSDKFDTFKFLQKYSIPQIPSFEFSDLNGIQTDNIILKPRDGVGCEDIKLLTTAVELDDVIHQADINKYIAQPYLQGQNASLSLLCLHGECLLLSANIQNIDKVNNSLVLRQCIVNALERDKFIEFSTKLIKTLPELCGYIGIDIIVTETEVLLVEINPRLTTSYVGLRSALGINPAALMLEVFINQKLPKLSFSNDKSIAVDIGAQRAA